MRFKKSIAILSIGIMTIGAMIGCEDDNNTTKYLTEEGKQLIQESKSYEYIELSEISLDNFEEENKQLGRHNPNVVVKGVIDEIEETETEYKIILVYPFDGLYCLQSSIPKEQCDIEIEKGDLIKIYGKYIYVGALKLNGKSPYYINAYRIEMVTKIHNNQ